MPVKKFILLFIFLFHLTFSNSIKAQIGGDNTYEFLNLTNSARIAAMGGNFLAIKDNDLSLALSNPSLITKEMDNHLVLSYVDYYADIKYGFVNYSKTFDKLGSFTTGFVYIDYGEFTRADEFGQTYEDFNVGENAFHIGWARQLDSNFSIGSNLRMIYSALESYYSFGIAVDVAANYYNPETKFAASFIAKNIGRQLSTYTPGNPEPLPFELQLGISKRLKHVPFRYSILFHHLEKFDLTYDDPNEAPRIDPLTGEIIEQGKAEDIADKILRHIIIGGEFIPARNFYIRFGYNYQKRQEMQVDTRVATVGFSWGFGMRISKFHFNYSRATYHLAGSPNFITITTNISNFYKH